MNESYAEAIWPKVSKVDGFLPDRVIDIVRANSAQADSSARVSDEDIRCLREAQYFSAAIPKHLGGGGATLLECAGMQRRIGSANAGLAVGLTMHMEVMAELTYMVSAGVKDFSKFLRTVSENQYIVSSAAAEPSLGGAVSKSSLSSARCDGGYLVSGKKSPVSLARLADYMVLQFPDPEKCDGETLGALVSMRGDGVSVEKTWNMLGARSSESDTIVLENCFVADDMCIKSPVVDPSNSSAPNPRYGLGYSLAWYCLPLIASYLGLVDCVLTETKKQLSSQKLHSKNTTRGSIPSFQSAYGEIVPKILVLECACASLAAQASHAAADFADILPYVLSLKYLAVDACTDAVAKAAELCGARSYGVGHVLARALRDVHALPHHGPNRILSRQFIGRLVLGMEIDYDYQG